MIYCVTRSEVERYLTDQGFTLEDSFEDYDVYVRGDDAITIRRGNDNGDITEIGMNEAFDEANLTPPDLDPHYCD